MEDFAGTHSGKPLWALPTPRPTGQTRPLPLPLLLLLIGSAGLLLAVLASGRTARPGTTDARGPALSLPPEGAKGLSAPASTATPTTPATTATATASATATACAGPNVVQNGGFETGDLAPWVIDGFNNPPVISTATPHTGQYDVLVGTLTGPEPTGNSSLYQQLTVPASGGTLSFWYWGYCAGCDSNSIVFDYQEALITDTDDNVLVTLLYAQENSLQWKNVTFDASSLAGLTIRVKFLVIQDGFGDDTAMYVDDVTLQPPAPCGSATPSPTGTLPSPTPTACAPYWSLQAHYPLVTADVAVASQGSTLYAFGGSPTGYSGALANAYKFDGTSWQPIAPLPVARAGASAVSDGTYLYILGGWDSNTQPTNTSYRYDPATDSYTGLAHYGVPTAWQAAAYLNGTIYRIGGCTGYNCYNNWWTSTVDAFTISTGTWAAVAPYPSPVGGAAAVGWNGYVYTAGGWGPPDGKTYRYDPVADTWDDGAIADLPTSLAFGASGLLGGRWVLAGGIEALSISARAIAWDPGSNEWSDLAPMLLPRAYLQGGTLGQAFYAVAGSEPNYPISSTNQQYLDVICATATATPTEPSQPSATSTVTATPTTPVQPSATSAVIATPTALAQPSATSAALPSPTTCTLQFTDVPPGSAFYTYVVCMACRGIISGYQCGGAGEPCDPQHNGYFRPGNDVTRGQLSKIIANSAGFDEVHTGQSFEDVLPTDPFYQYIERMASRGIIGGYQCGGDGEPCIPPDDLPYFRPGANATRGQIAKMDVLAAAQALGWQLLNPPSSTFEDVAVGSTFFRYVETAVAHGVLGGYPCGQPPAGPCIPPGNKPYFLGGNNTTRGQTSKIVANTFLPACSAARKE